VENLQFLVENYQTPPEAIELVEKSRILLLAGISGAGKDTTKKHLLRNYEGYRDIVSHTTRAPRENNGKMEQNGVHYNFISQEEAEKMLLDREFIEAKFVHGKIYGTSVAEIQRAFDAGQISVTDIDIHGIAEYKKLSDKVVAVMILPPDYETWRARFANRYQSQAEFERDFEKRLPEAISALEMALEVPYYHFILNDDFRNTARIIDQIMHQDVEFNYKDIEVRVRAEKLLSEIKREMVKISDRKS
jgi:guanylate kinase